MLSILVGQILESQVSDSLRRFAVLMVVPAIGRHQPASNDLGCDPAIHHSPIVPSYTFYIPRVRSMPPSKPFLLLVSWLMCRHRPILWQPPRLFFSLSIVRLTAIIPWFTLFIGLISTIFTHRVQTRGIGVHIPRELGRR